MIQFRGSAAGNCTREIVLRHTTPELFTLSDDKRLFLDAGHYLQMAAEAFLRESLPAPLVLRTDLRESEGAYIHEDRWKVVGHVDGVLDTDEAVALLEVKAIKNTSFVKLKKADHWKDLYGHYTYQAQTYLHFRELHSEDGALVLPERMDFAGTYFIFYNRDTSEMLGGIKIDHAGYTYRPDMFEERDPDLWQKVIDKYDRAYAHIQEGTEPEGCDAEGWCFFCRQRGTGNQLRREKRVGLLGDDPENQDIMDSLELIESYRDSIAMHFADLKADVIVLEDGTTLKKGDYV